MAPVVPLTTAVPTVYRVGGRKHVSPLAVQQQARAEQADAEAASQRMRSLGTAAGQDGPAAALCAIASAERRASAIDGIDIDIDRGECGAGGDGKR